MAYEVARVHGLILSNIKDGEKDSSTKAWGLSQNNHQNQPRSSPDTPFLYDLPSDLTQWSESSHSSSLESSTETESDDEDDFIAGLAEQIAHSMLQDDETTLLPENPERDGSLEGSLLMSHINAVSPKISSSPHGSWCQNNFSASSSESVSSSKQSSQVSSPPSTPSTLESSAWDLLNAAAGEVVRLKRNEERRSAPVKPISYSPVAGSEAAKHCGRLPQQQAVWRSQPDLSPLSSSPSYDSTSRMCTQAASPKDRIVGGQPNLRNTRTKDEDRKASNNGQHRIAKYDGNAWNQRHVRTGNAHKGASNQKLSRQNLVGGQARMPGKPMERNVGMPRAGAQGINGGSGMRAVFLGSAGSGRESGGTGVFLPRCVGAGSDHRRKPACSTVLLPSRIVQVLNLNVEDMRSHPAPLAVVPGHNRTEHSGGGRNPPHMYMMDLTAGTMKSEGGDLSAFPRKSQGPQARLCASSRPNDSIEYSLPTEWTY